MDFDFVYPKGMKLDLLCRDVSLSIGYNLKLAPVPC